MYKAEDYSNLIEKIYKICNDNGVNAVVYFEGNSGDLGECTGMNYKNKIILTYAEKIREVNFYVRQAITFPVSWNTSIIELITEAIKELKATE